MEGDDQEDQLNYVDEPVDAEASVLSPEPGDQECSGIKSQIGGSGEVEPGEGESLFKEPVEVGLKDGDIHVEESRKGKYQDGNDGEGGSQGGDTEGNSKEGLEEMERQSLKEEHLERESQRGDSPTENRKENGEELSLGEYEESQDPTEQDVSNELPTENKKESAEEISLERDKVGQDPFEQGNFKEAKENDTDNNKGNGEGPQGEGETPTTASPQGSQLAGFRALYPASEGLSLLKPHQSDNLSAITEENSNIGDESTNKSFTEEEKEIEEAEDNEENDGKRCTVFSQVS